MKLIYAATLLMWTAGAALAQATQPAAVQGARADRVVGVVSAAADPASGALTVRADDGQTIAVAHDERTTYLRVAPGSTSLEGAARITLAEVGVGDRVLVLLRAGAAGSVPVARQVIVTSAAELAATREREREEARRRTLTGRVSTLDAARRQFTVTTRGREGAEASVVVSAAADARFLRFAPDSMRAADASPATFAELRPGDQVRLSGERSPDGASFAAKEVLAGSFVRAGGEVTAVNQSAGEFTLKDELTGRTFTVALGRRSTLRRVPDELAEQFARRREGQRERRAEGGGAGDDAGREARRAERREERRRERAARGEGEGERGRRRGGEGRPREGGGMNLQRALEGLPAITLAELRKGDAVIVTGTPSPSDDERLTAVAAYTGDAEFLQRLLRIQGRRGERDMSPGLPGDVLGGGTLNREPPPQPPR